MLKITDDALGTLRRNHIAENFSGEKPVDPYNGALSLPILAMFQLSLESADFMCLDKAAYKGTPKPSRFIGEFHKYHICRPRDYSIEPRPSQRAEWARHYSHVSPSFLHPTFLDCRL